MRRIGQMSMIDGMQQELTRLQSELTEQVKVAIVAGAEYAFNTSGVNGGLTLCEEEVEQIFDKLKGE